MTLSRRTPSVRRPWQAGLAGMTGLAAIAAALVVAVPSAGAAPSCTTIAPEPAPAVDLVASSAQVPFQSAGARVTVAVRDAVDDALVAGRVGTSAEDQGALWLDTCGQAFYVEPSSPATQQTAGVGGATQGVDQQLVPLADTFELSSKPGSSRTIYLDFTGHTITGTSWNGNYGWGSSQALSAYDYESGPGTFSDSERVNVQNVWALVAEDYAPFDVNVTTADPGTAAITRDGAGDTVFGTRAVITNDATGQTACGCGGIAYIGVFNNPTNHAYYQPALVFTRGVGHGAKNVAEALSHEVGHNLGLVHQGVANGAGYYTGHGSWAPIMGVGYYKPVSQWARGQYANASSTQDELSTIVATGLPYRTDDHGDHAAAATPLSGPLSAGVSAEGVISTPTDVDTFAVTLPSAGDLTIAATPTAVGANLDLRMLVRDAGGSIVADVDPLVTHAFSDRADNLDARVTLTGVAAGTYSVALDGVGARNALNDGYTDYGSLGQYELTVTAVSSDAPVVTSPAPGELTTGAAYRHLFAATSSSGGALTWRLSGALPKGVVFDPATGTLSGKTTIKGAFPVVVTVSDGQGRESSRAYTLRSAGPLLAGSLTARPAAAVGTGLTGQLAASGGTAPYRWTATSKPAWATVSTGGAVTGTPTIAGPDAFVLTVTDAAGRSVTKGYTLTVTGPLAIRDLAGRLGGSVGGTVIAGTRFSFPVPTYGGKRAYTFTPGSLPTGVTVTSGGVVSGLRPAAGTSSLTVSVRDVLGASVTKTLTLRAVSALVLAGDAPGASLGKAYTATFTPGGGVAPYTVAATGVPAGLTFDPATRVLAGTPTALSTSAAVAFTLTDSAGRVVTRRVPLAVRPGVTTTVDTLPAASMGRSYSGRLTATGGAGTYTWRVATGALPTGLKLATSGVVSGTPTAAGTFVATFTATDAQGRSATTGALGIAVASPVAPLAAVLPVATLGQAYSQSLVTEGGTGSYTYSTASRLPAGLSLSVGGVISGTPATRSSASVAVKVTDSAGRTASRTYSLRVV